MLNGRRDTVTARAADKYPAGAASVASHEDIIPFLRAQSERALGSYRVDVGYDSTLVTATECMSAEGECSIDAVASDTVRMNGSSLSGITGTDVQIGTITFVSDGPEGTAALTVDASTLVVTDIDNEPMTVTPTDGVITIVAATPAPTASPTPTPAVVPVTGGAPGASGTTSISWLLAATGLAAVAGGAWVLARAGREN